MDTLTQQVMQQLSGGGVRKISKQIGAEEQTTASALAAVMPLLLTALANNASKPEGAQSLHQALAQDHDGSILNDVSGYLNAPQTANGAGILGHVLGSQQSTVTQGVAQATGLSNEQVGQLMQIAAPLLMGALGQQQQQQNLDTGSLATLLGSQQEAAKQENPDLMGVLNTFLDADRDGSAIDEIIGMASQLFRKK